MCLVIVYIWVIISNILDILDYDAMHYYKDKI